MNASEIIDRYRKSNEGPHNRGLTLRGLLDKLKALPYDAREAELSVLSESITDIGVYRGHNSDLALYYERDMNYPGSPAFKIKSSPMTIADIIGELEDIADGKEMNTYKCGPVVLKETANVWVTVYSECHGFYITDIVFVKLDGGDYAVGAVLENIPYSVEMYRGVANVESFIEELKTSCD